jgi:hypothetical protein
MHPKEDVWGWKRRGELRRTEPWESELARIGQ